MNSSEQKFLGFKPGEPDFSAIPGDDRNKTNPTNNHRMWIMAGITWIIALSLIFLPKFLPGNLVRGFEITGNRGHKEDCLKTTALAGKVVNDPDEFEEIYEKESYMLKPMTTAKTGKAQNMEQYEKESYVSKPEAAGSAVTSSRKTKNVVHYNKESYISKPESGGKAMSSSRKTRNVEHYEKESYTLKPKSGGKLSSFSRKKKNVEHYEKEIIVLKPESGGKATTYFRNMKNVVRYEKESYVSKPVRN